MTKEKSFRKAMKEKYGKTITRAEARAIRKRHEKRVKQLRREGLHK